MPFLLDEQTIGLRDSFTFETSAGNLDCLGTPAGTSGYGDLRETAEVLDLGERLQLLQFLEREERIECRGCHRRGRRTRSSNALKLRASSTASRARSAGVSVSSRRITVRSIPDDDGANDDDDDDDNERVMSPSLVPGCGFRVAMTLPYNT